jgi:hypothetical protein
MAKKVFQNLPAVGGLPEKRRRSVVKLFSDQKFSTVPPFEDRQFNRTSVS